MASRWEGWDCQWFECDHWPKNCCQWFKGELFKGELKLSSLWEGLVCNHNTLITWPLDNQNLINLKPFCSCMGLFLTCAMPALACSWPVTPPNVLHNSSNCCYVFLWANFPSYLHLWRDQICINYLLSRPTELGEWMPLFRAQTKTSWYQWVGPWSPAVTSPSFRKLPRYTLVSGLVKLIEAFVFKLGWGLGMVRQASHFTLLCYASTPGKPPALFTGSPQWWQKVIAMQGGRLLLLYLTMYHSGHHNMSVSWLEVMASYACQVLINND